MDALYDQYKKTINYYLKNYNTIKSCEELRRESILESFGGYRMDASGIRSTKKSDVTATKALELANANEDAIWLKIIDAVLKNYPNEFASNYVKEKFNINRFKEQETSYLYLCSRVTFQRYKKEIIIEIAKAYVKLSDTIMIQK